MREIVDVNTGEVKVSGGRVLLRSLAIGSCVVVCAYNGAGKIGGIAHIMLPGGAPQKSIEKTKYAQNAIDELFRMMSQAGSQLDDIEVCVVGGGNVLGREDDTICEANINSVTQLLEKKDIGVRVSMVGGVERKSVFMDIETGSISYTHGDEKEKVLWQSKSLEETMLESEVKEC